MTVKEIDAEIERAERDLTRQLNEKDVLTYVARGVWEIARQLAVSNTVRWDSKAKAAEYEAIRDSAR
jgi:hypothetical protein